MLSCLFLQPCGHMLGGAGLLSLCYVMFSYVLVTFLYGVLAQVWCLIVSISDLCLIHYFTYNRYNNDGKQFMLMRTSGILLHDNLLVCCGFHAMQYTL